MEIGDKIVCIDVTNIFNEILNITFNKTYTIDNIKNGMFYINDDVDEISAHYTIRFISLEKNRRNKILKLKERICLELVTK